MTDEIGVMSGDSLSIKIPEDRVDPYEHSFRQIGSRKGTEVDSDVVTVMLEARFTRLRVAGEPVQFAGFRYFPNIHDSPLDAHVDMKDDWGGYIDADHPAHGLRVRDLHRGLKNGKITPLGKENANL